jgi:uncharacterized protein
MRVVLDANVVISSLLFRGPLSAIHAAWTSERFVLLLSRQVLGEHARVLAYPKFRLSEAEIAGLLRSELLQYAEPVEVVSRVDTVRADPADNRFLELAVDGNADLVASGNRHLLDLVSWRGIPILSARGLLDRLG